MPFVHFHHFCNQAIIILSFQVEDNCHIPQLDRLIRKDWDDYEFSVLVSNPTIVEGKD